MTAKTEISQTVDPAIPEAGSDEYAMDALLNSYGCVQRWINLADTKAGLALTINGVIAGFILQLPAWKEAFSPVAGSRAWWWGACLFLYSLSQIGSFLYNIEVFFPRVIDVGHGATRHVFPVSIVRAFPAPGDREKMWQEYRELTVEDLKREYVYQLHADSLVCNRKYKSLRCCVKSLLLAVGFAALLLLSHIVLGST